MPGTTATEPSVPLARRRWLALAAPVFGLMIVGLDDDPHGRVADTGY